MTPVSVVVSALPPAAGDNSDSIRAGGNHRDAFPGRGQDLRRRDARETADQQKAAGPEDVQSFPGSHACTWCNVSQNAQGTIC